MNTKQYSHLLLFFIGLITAGCANVVPITGGEKDTKEPQLKKIIPKIGSTHFSGGVILFEFDEEIEVENNPRNIITSPVIEGEIKLKVKKKKYLELSIPKNLEPNTTYSININDAVKDITEGNKKVNITYAFSTGEQLDSLSFTGRTVDMQYKIPQKNVLIGLYKKSDTLDIRKQKPLYITYSNANGQFELKYLKENEYYLLALEDKNSNLLYDNQEKGTSITSLLVNTDLKNITNLELSASDTTSNKILSRKINQKIQVLSFRNGIKHYTYETLNSEDQIYILQNKQRAKDLFVYTQTNQKDSVQYIINSLDSLGNQRTDTIVLNLFNKKTKKEEAKIHPESMDFLPGKKSIAFISSKPILTINTDSIKIGKTETQITHQLSSNRDSLYISLEEIAIEDTTKINFKKGSIILYEGDTLSPQVFNILKADPSNYSSLEMTIKTEAENYIIQLMSDNYQILEEYKNIRNLKYHYIKPGKYRIRAIIDINNNGYWDSGNLLKNEKAEPIKYFDKEATNLKPNWEIKDLMFIF